jgi:hypothetical protein
VVVAVFRPPIGIDCAVFVHEGHKLFYS